MDQNVNNDPSSAASANQDPDSPVLNRAGNEKVIEPMPAPLGELQFQQQQNAQPLVSNAAGQPRLAQAQQNIVANVPGANPLFPATPQTGFSQADASVIEKKARFRKKLTVACLTLIALIILIVAYFVFSDNKTGDPNVTSTWKDYTNSQAGFSAVFIRTPTHQSTASGDLYLSKSSDNQNEYTVGVAKDTTDINSFLNGEVKSLTDGEIQSQKEVSVNGHAAEDVTFSGLYEGQEENFTARIIADNNNLYEAYTIGYGSPAINSEYFINHFKLLQ